MGTRLLGFSRAVTALRNGNGTCENERTQALQQRSSRLTSSMIDPVGSKSCAHLEGVGFGRAKRVVEDILGASAAGRRLVVLLLANMSLIAGRGSHAFVGVPHPPVLVCMLPEKKREESRGFVVCLRDYSLSLRPHDCLQCGR